jgi:hypothetical protein
LEVFSCAVTIAYRESPRNRKIRVNPQIEAGKHAPARATARIASDWGVVRFDTAFRAFACHCVCMSQDTYRITSPCLYMFLENGHYVSGMLPKESIIAIASEHFNGNKLVEVIFEEKVVMMFTQDLRSRGEKVK